MPEINSLKAYTQTPLHLEKLKNFDCPDDWLTLLGNLIDDLLQAEKPHNDFLYALNKHAGPASTYPLKSQLLDSLKIIYAALVNLNSIDEETALAAKILECSSDCASGFHHQVNTYIFSLSTPKSFDDLLTNRRYEVTTTILTRITDYIQTENRFFIVAQDSGYGVRPYNPESIFQGDRSDESIKQYLEKGFPTRYTFFSTLIALQELLLTLLRSQGYEGKREAGYECAIYTKLAETLKPFLDISFKDLFILRENDSNESVLDINWINVKQALFKKLHAAHVFNFSMDEEALLSRLLNHNDTYQPLLFCKTLFPHHGEFAACLVFFKEWPVDKKSALFFDYIGGNSLEQQKVILNQLEKIPEFIKEYKKIPEIQNHYLRFAIEKNQEKIKQWVEQGADLNIALPFLLSQDKSDTFYWLHQRPELLAKIQQNTMNMMISDGPNKGKSIAAIFIQSKKGRQILAENEQLRAICPTVIAHKFMNEWMQQAKGEKNSICNLFFTPVNPDLMKLLNHVVHGQQALAEAMILQNPQLLLCKGRVKDYSRRTIDGTALQIALGAEDVGYHENEECMVEMIQKHLRTLANSDEIIAQQTKEQFPEEWEIAEEERVKKDSAALNKVMDVIVKTAKLYSDLIKRKDYGSLYTCLFSKGYYNNDTCEEALQEFRNYLEPKGTIKTGKHFNTQLLLEAFRLYDQNYEKIGDWYSHQNDLPWCKLIGYIQRYSPACLAQAFSQGLYTIVDCKKPLKRTLNFKHSPYNAPYFPIDLNLPSRLGYHYVAGPWEGIASQMDRRCAREMGKALKTLSQTKAANLQDLVTRHPRQVSPMYNNGGP